VIGSPRYFENDGSLKVEVCMYNFIYIKKKAWLLRVGVFEMMGPTGISSC